MCKFCENCGKELTNKYQKRFCSKSCAASYNNRHRKHTTKGKTKIAKCIVCGEEFEASIHIPYKKCKCPNCKLHNRVHSKELSNINNIFDISSRTRVKILKMIGCGCSICGWNEATCDIHHIIPKKAGGTNDDENLIYVCPNCHRICHVANKYSIEELKEKSLDKMNINWKEYYHMSN